MPWYLSYGRVVHSIVNFSAASVQFYWILEAEDRYRRSLTWKPVVATVVDHKLLLWRMGASHVEYTFPDPRLPPESGAMIRGCRFKSGGLYEEEFLKNPKLLGVGTEIVVYYNPNDPTENTVKITDDHATVVMFAATAFFNAFVAYRVIRHESIIPGTIYRAFSANRRMVENTGLKAMGKQPATNPGAGGVPPKTGKFSTGPVWKKK
eukprot:PhM_4_TR7710/c0_g2_i1/m.64638